MSMSNIEYSVLKKRAGLHNWGFMPSKENLEFELGYDLDVLTPIDIEELTEAEQDIYAEPEVFSQNNLAQNNLGEYYALQDYEE